jgi:ThiF family
MVVTSLDRFARLRETTTFRNGGLARFIKKRAIVFGVGALGGPLAQTVVRSGAAVCVVDYDIGTFENQGTQPVEPGISKVKAIVAACDAIEPGRALAFECDARHVGIGVFDQCDLLIDCTDDPNLAWPLTEISNGVGKPLIRCALDGSGDTESGRVLLSSGGTGHACQLCSYSLKDLHPNRERTGCPNQPKLFSSPTIAGGAIAMAIAGLGLLSAQRVLTGNDDNLVYDHETHLNLTHLQLLPMKLTRSEGCLSGHVRWELMPINAAAANVTFAELFSIASRELSSAEVTLEPYLHPLCIQAECVCGQLARATGSQWAQPPECAHCGECMSWRRAIQYDRVSMQHASDLGILGVPLTTLGLPEQGAMLVARTANRPPVRFVLQCEKLEFQKGELIAASEYRL